MKVWTKRNRKLASAAIEQTRKLGSQRDVYNLARKICGCRWASLTEQQRIDWLDAALNLLNDACRRT